MQLTRIDRWLRERFVYETHVFAIRQPQHVPAGIITQEMPDTPGRTYRHRFIARNPKLASELITILKDNNQMFTTRIVDRSAWYVPMIAPKDKSVVFWLAWLGISVVACYAATLGIRMLWNNPEFREHLVDALKVLQQ